MNVLLNKACFAAAAILSLLVLTSVASAAPSLGFPTGKPYYGSQQFGWQSNVYNNNGNNWSAPRGETRQSFSYEPSDSDDSNAADKSSASDKRDSSDESAAEGTKCGCSCGGDSAEHQAANQHDENDNAASPDVDRRSNSYEPRLNSERESRAYQRDANPKQDSRLRMKGEQRRNHN